MHVFTQTHIEFVWDDILDNVVLDKAKVCQESHKWIVTRVTKMVRTPQHEIDLQICSMKEKTLN